MDNGEEALDFQDLYDLQALANLRNLKRQLDQKKQAKPKKVWIRQWVGRRNDNIPLYKEITVEDREKFFANFRLYPEHFDTLLGRIESKIAKQDTAKRKAIPARIRLQVTLRYLASGASYSVLEDLFRIPKSTLSTLIPEVCESIWAELNKESIITPQTEEEWRIKAKEFLDQWQYPYGVGAIDGKHVVIQAFANSGTNNRNYKGQFSIVLFALVDANYKFMYVDIGEPGSQNDARIWNDSKLKKALNNGSLKFPPANDNIEFHFIGDDIFGLDKCLMKQFTRHDGMSFVQKIFNYRLSRARRVVENAFGIMASRFRVLRTPLLLNYTNAISVVKAVVTLHNYIINNCNSDKTYFNPGQVEDDDGNLRLASWEQQDVTNFTPLGQLAGNRSGTDSAKFQREKIAALMVTDGLAPWQFKMAFRTS